jgi:Zn-finger protein
MNNGHWRHKNCGGELGFYCYGMFTANEEGGLLMKNTHRGGSVVISCSHCRLSLYTNGEKIDLKTTLDQIGEWRA